MECVVRLNESWCTGLAGYFAESGCVDIEWVIRDCLFTSCDQVCEEPADAGAFDLDRFLSNCGSSTSACGSTEVRKSARWHTLAHRRPMS